MKIDLQHIVTRMGVFVSPCFTLKTIVEEFANTTLRIRVKGTLHGGDGDDLSHDEHVRRHALHLLNAGGHDVEVLKYDDDEGNRLYRFFSPHGGLPQVKLFKKDWDASEYALTFDDRLQAQTERLVEGVWCTEDPGTDGWWNGDTRLALGDKRTEE